MARIMRLPDPQKVLTETLEQFVIDDELLAELTKAFLAEIHEGLSSYGHPLAMIPTFVTGVPDGTETGTFLALDLGGTNLRVCEVELHGDHTFSLRQQKYRVSEALKTGEATTLFDYLADSVDAFLTENSPMSDMPNSAIPPSLSRPFSLSSPIGSPNGTPGNRSPAIPDMVHLGLTFSFPVEQTALDSGTLLTWTKGFAAKNAAGKDVVKLLQDAFDRKHMHVRCVALVNDTVGALLSRAYTAGGCILGAIFGTGTNGAYVEEVSKITKLQGSPATQQGGFMVVNTEWGAFNNSRSHLPSTPFDNKLDRESINPRLQAYEKFISGMYLGEITRNVLLAFLDAAPHPLIFGGKASKALNTHYGLDTAIMSAVELAWGVDSQHESLTGFLWTPEWEEQLDETLRKRLQQVKEVVIHQLGYAPEDVNLRDAAIVRAVCKAVASRAAKLSGCAIATILVQTGRAVLGGRDRSNGEEGEKLRIGVDGSLVEHYPGFERGLRESLRVLVGEDVEKRTEIGMAKDGSGVGAALSALQATKQFEAGIQQTLRL